MGTYTAHPNLRNWEILGGPCTKCKGKCHDMQLVVVGLSLQHAELHDPNTT
jgi:hypothetical protein